MENEGQITVKVCYAYPNHQETISLVLPAQSNVLNAIQASGILDKYPEINLTENNIGIFSSIVNLEHVLSDNDRIEIYRPLIRDPMEARRLRAELNK